MQKEYLRAFDGREIFTLAIYNKYVARTCKYSQGRKRMVCDDKIIGFEYQFTDSRYSKMWDEYEALRDGYKDKDGKHILGYNELVQRHKELLQDPARLLETEEGQQVLEEAKEEIVETVQKNLVSNMLGFIKREIFDTLKEWLVEPIYKAINEMMRGHWFQLNDNDKKILTGAIDRTVDRLVDKLDIGSKIEENVCENMPSENQIEQEVQRIYRGRGR